jgi:subtilisin family serine protease
LGTGQKITRTALALGIGPALIAIAPVGASAANIPGPKVGKAASLVRNSCPTVTGSTKQNYIVRFADQATDSDVTRLIRSKNGQLKRRLSKAFNGAVVELTPANARALCVLNDPSLRWVEEDQNITVSPLGGVRPSSVAAGSWGIDRIDQRSGLNNTYSYATDGAGVDVYVVDSGILATHTEFSTRVRTGYSAFSGGTDTTDCNGHGTHVAGTAAGASLGVAPMASVIPVKVLDCNGAGTLSGVIAGIDWVINDHTTTPAVMNLSLGATKSESLNSAIDRAFLDNITVVVAAGNSNVNACDMSPASAVSSALTVGATTSSDARASYSNFGECLDLFAPGSGITSAWHTGNTATNTVSGTSMASPHVAGLAARYLSAAPTAVPTQVMDALIGYATQNVVSGAGTLSPNLLAYSDPSTVPPPPPLVAPINPDAITSTPGRGTTAAPSVPGKPSRPRAITGIKSSQLRWKAVANGGLPITGHMVQILRRGTLVGRIVVDADAVHTIGALRAGSNYTFRVAAMNAVGIGPFSPESRAIVPLKMLRTYQTPRGASTVGVLPERPTGVTVRQVSTSVIVRWQVPTNTDATTYEISFMQGGRTVARAVIGNVAGARISGLKRGTYKVQVRAVNTAGKSPLSRSARLVMR